VHRQAKYSTISCLVAVKMASEGSSVPDSLYNLGVAAVIDNYQCFKHELRILPDSLLFDLYYKVRIFMFLISACDSTTNFVILDETRKIRNVVFFTFVCAVNFNSLYVLDVGHV
jgi:hypothetical protein